MSDNNFFAKNLIYLLERNRINASYLANQLGISNSGLGLYLKEERTPKIDFLLQVSYFFKVSTDDLLKRDISEVYGVTGSVLNSKEHELETNNMVKKFINLKDPEEKVNFIFSELMKHRDNLGMMIPQVSELILDVEKIKTAKSIQK